MWIVSSHIFKSIYKLLFNIENQLAINHQMRVHTARRLIDFQQMIELFNNDLHVYNINILNKQINSRYYLFNIRCMKIKLITYLSAWSIYVKQNVISPNTLNKCLGLLLTEEQRILSSSLNRLIQQKSQNYTDGLNCKWLFSTVLS